VLLCLIDLSLSVEVAYDRTRYMENVFIAQASIFELPFEKEFFDIIFSNGVIHHTPDPGKAFQNMCSHLKPGGLIGIYVYNVKPFLREMADKAIRKVTTDMSFEECMEFSGKIKELGKSLQKFKDDIEIAEDIPVLNIKKGKYNLQKFIYDHFLKCFYNEEMGEDISVLINQDWYHPKYASHHKREEVSRWFEENSISDIRFVQPKGWEHSGFFVSGRKKI